MKLTPLLLMVLLSLIWSETPLLAAGNTPANAQATKSPNQNKATLAVTNTILTPRKNKIKIKTIPELQAAIAKTKDPVKRFNAQTELLIRYSIIPIRSKIIRSARPLAIEVLKNAPKFKKNWDYGNAIHHSHIVLGRIFFYNEDFKRSAIELIAASHAPTSPQLSVFGPNMVLAKQLLEMGYKADVIKYIDNSLKVWKSPAALNTANGWKRTIKRGRRPDFGLNLAV